MMDPETIENAKRACLKQSFGGALDPHELELLNSYLESAEGKQYMDNSNEMKHLLGDVAEVSITASVDSAAMVTAFESMARDNLRELRRRMPLFLVLTSGLWLLTGGIFLNSGKPEAEFFGWTMLVGAALFAVFFIALWRQQGARIEDKDLLQRMDEDRELGNSKSVIISYVILAIAFFAILGVGVAKMGGSRGVVIWAAVTALCIYAGSIVRQRKRRQHQQLWDWWDGREA